MQTTTSHRRYFWLLLAIPVLAFGGLGLAQAQGFGGPGFGMHGGHGPGGDPAGFFKKRLDRMLDEVKATDAQRAAVAPIVESLHAKQKPLHAQMKAIHEKMADAFAAQTVDAGVVENLRQEGLKLHDQLSRNFTDAAVKIGAVLTVEQRKQIIEHMKEHGPGRRFGR